MNHKEMLCYVIQTLLKAQTFNRVPKDERVQVQKAAVFKERRKESGEMHYHVAVMLDRHARFCQWKIFMQSERLACNFRYWKLDSMAKRGHMPRTADNQCRMVLRYCYTPSPKKQLQDMDTRPLLYAWKDERHPPLDEMTSAELCVETQHAGCNDCAKMPRKVNAAGRNSRMWTSGRLLLNSRWTQPIHN